MCRGIKKTPSSTLFVKEGWNPPWHLKHKQQMWDREHMVQREQGWPGQSPSSPNPGQSCAMDSFPGLSWTQPPEGLMLSFLLLRPQDTSQKEKAKISIKWKTHLRGGDWQPGGLGAVPGNAARAVPPHTMSGWDNSTEQRPQRACA